MDECMENLCDNAIGDYAKSRCRLRAASYSRGIRTLIADDAYEDAQKNACSCCGG
jgi:hypothetical protein